MKLLIFLFLIMLNFASPTPIPKSKPKFACESFGARLNIENQEIAELAPNYAQLGEFPFVAGLHYDDGEFRCTGVLISEKFIVTSANCVRKRSFNPDFVRLGRTSLNTNETRDSSKAVDINIEQIIIHPEFNVRQKQNNIALIKLAEPVNFTSFIFPACLNEENSTNEENFINAGYGVAYIQRRIIPKSDWLLKVAIKNVPKETCEGKFGAKITEKHLCAVDDVEFNELCSGASGGPLGVSRDGKFFLHATMSFGRSCGYKNPVVFTRISSYVPWIEENCFRENLINAW